MNVSDYAVHVCVCVCVRVCVCVCVCEYVFVCQLTSMNCKVAIIATWDSWSITIPLMHHHL